MNSCRFISYHCLLAFNLPPSLVSFAHSPRCNRERFIVILQTKAHSQLERESILKENWHDKKMRNENVDRETHAALRDKYFIIISAGFIDRRELLQIFHESTSSAKEEKKKNCIILRKHTKSCVHVKIKIIFFFHV